MNFIYHHTYNGNVPPRNKRLTGDQYTAVIYGLPEKLRAGDRVKVHVGVAFCHPDDYYDRDVGKILAERAIKEVDFDVFGGDWDGSPVFALMAPGLIVEYTWKVKRPLLVSVSYRDYIASQVGN